MKNMKYKVLAADDEFWSRENIRNLIPWEEYSLEFLEPACDGEERSEERRVGYREDCRRKTGYYSHRY